VDCMHLAQDRGQWQAGSCEHGVKLWVL
jgi:hypothetical protein